MRKNSLLLVLIMLSLGLQICNCIKAQKAITTTITTNSLGELDKLSTLFSNNNCSEYRTLNLSVKKYHIQEAGVNVRSFRKLFQSFAKWKYFKSIRNWFRKLLRIEKKNNAKEVEQILKNRKIMQILPSAETLSKTFEDLKSNEDVSMKISEYLNQVPRSNYNTVKTIRCLKQDANEIRFMLWDGNISRVNKIIESGTETIKLFEYDINSMQEFTQIGENGIEYVYFRIPKYPHYVLEGKYPGRVYQCMVFGLPKDTAGNWEKFRAFLIDLFTHPMQLWDEWQFRKELSKFNINSRDLQEIEEYQFAKNEVRYEDSQFLKKEVA